MQAKEGFDNKIKELTTQLEDEHARFEGIRDQLDLANKLLNDKQSATPQVSFLLEKFIRIFPFSTCMYFRITTV